MLNPSPARALAATLWGVEARIVNVEVMIEDGPTHLEILGLHPSATRESRERVRRASKQRLRPRRKIHPHQPHPHGPPEGGSASRPRHRPDHPGCHQLLTAEGLPTRHLSKRPISRSLRGSGAGDRQTRSRGGCRRRPQPSLSRTSRLWQDHARPPLSRPLAATHSGGVDHDPKIYSLVTEEPQAGLCQVRPFRSPHPGTSIAGMIGRGGSTILLARAKPPSPTPESYSSMTSPTSAAQPSTPCASPSRTGSSPWSGPEAALSFRPVSLCWPR